jgi:hypothetical protein
MGAPVKPFFACPGRPWGLSGIMAPDLPLPVCHARLREIEIPQTGFFDPRRSLLRKWSSPADSQAAWDRHR